MKSVRPEDTDRLVDDVIEVELTGTGHSEQSCLEKREHGRTATAHKREAGISLGCFRFIAWRQNDMDQRGFEQDKLSLRAVSHCGSIIPEAAPIHA